MTAHRTSLHARHLAHAARMVPFGGWDMPVQYTGVLDEHAAVRTAAGLFDIGHMARLSFAGTDVLPFLESVTTNAVGTMKDGQVRYGLVCNAAGGIKDDVLVYRFPYGFAMVVNASNREKILAHFAAETRGRDVQVTDMTFTSGMVAVQGPRSVELVGDLFAADVTGLKYYFAMPTRYRDTPCVVSRTGYTGEDGFEVMVQADQAEPLWNDLLARGALPCGLGARDTLRLEAAMPLYGHELTEDIDPVQAGLGWAVKPAKGEFLGRDAILNRPADRPVRVGLELAGKRAAREGSAVLLNGTPAGTVTSGSFVPHLQKSIAMAYVPPGTAGELEVDVRGTRLPARVVPLPFYQRSK